MKGKTPYLAVLPSPFNHGPTWFKRNKDTTETMDRAIPTAALQVTANSCVLEILRFENYFEIDLQKGSHTQEAKL